MSTIVNQQPGKFEKLERTQRNQRNFMILRGCANQLAKMSLIVFSEIKTRDDTSLIICNIVSICAAS
jgi:hypothetical protein